MVLSVIIPVYNAGCFIPNLVASLSDQGLGDTEYEVLLVDDGSEDDSLQVMEREIQDRRNFRIVRKANGGVSSARNAGIVEAEGDYVMFVDADDTLVPGSLALVRQTIQNFPDMDVIRFGSMYLREYHSGQTLLPFDKQGVTEYPSGVDHIKKCGLNYFCWSMAYRRSFLVGRNLRYQPYRLGEDLLFTTEVLLQCGRMISIPYKLYIYNYREGSATTNHEKTHEQRGAFDYTHAMEAIIREVEDTHDEELIHVVRENLNHNMQAIGIFYYYGQFSIREYRELRKLCRKCNLLPVRRGGLRGLLGNIPYYAPWLYPLMQRVFRKVIVPIHALMKPKK